MLRPEEMDKRKIQESVTNRRLITKILETSDHKLSLIVHFPQRLCYMISSCFFFSKIFSLDSSNFFFLIPPVIE